jgi:hypothetical protein
VAEAVALKGLVRAPERCILFRVLRVKKNAELAMVHYPWPPDADHTVLNEALELAMAYLELGEILVAIANQPQVDQGMPRRGRPAA